MSTLKEKNLLLQEKIHFLCLGFRQESKHGVTKIVPHCYGKLAEEHQGVLIHLNHKVEGLSLLLVPRLL